MRETWATEMKFVSVLAIMQVIFTLQDHRFENFVLLKFFVVLAKVQASPSLQIIVSHCLKFCHLLATRQASCKLLDHRLAFFLSRNRFSSELSFLSKLRILCKFRESALQDHPLVWYWS